MNRLMRILVMFDLPVKTKAERRSATQFRNFLVGDGYHMYSTLCMRVSATAEIPWRPTRKEFCWRFRQRGLCGCW